MNFKLIDDAIRVCKKHLDDTKTRNTEVENHLAAYLLVLISAQFELRIEALIEAYAARIQDKQIRRFVVDRAKNMTRAPNVGSITGMLAAISHDGKNAFHKLCGGQAQSAYNSIIENRHAFVHEAKCNVTIGDLEGYFNDSRGVFSAVVGVLGLKANEIAHLH
jgi:hypothetical protein